MKPIRTISGTACLKSRKDSRAAARIVMLSTLLLEAVGLAHAQTDSTQSQPAQKPRVFQQTVIPGTAAPPLPAPVPRINPKATATNGIDTPPAIRLISTLKPEIQLTDSGAQATWGRTKAYFPSSLDSPVAVTTPDARHLSFRPTFLVLENRATGETLLLGTVTNRNTGAIQSANSVTWNDIFDTGPRASLEIVYDAAKGSLEQNLHLDESITNIPSSWDPADTVIECWTEWWIDGAPPRVESRAVALRPASGLQAAVISSDDTISFGASRITAGGKAFLAGDNSATLPVAKSWIQISSGQTGAPPRRFLIEALDYIAAKPQLDALPKPTRQASLSAPKKRRSDLLMAGVAADVSPAPRAPNRGRLTNSPRPHMTAADSQLSSLSPKQPASPSLILDFVLLEAVPLPTGAISWWPGGSNALDALPNHNDGTEYNVTYAAAEVGQGFSFDGTNAHAHVADSASLHVTNALTIEAWINPASYASPWFRDIVGKWDLAGSPPQKSYDLSLANDSTAYLVLSSNGDDSGAQFVVTSNAIPFDTWTHVAGVYDGTAIRMYFNGSPDRAGSYTNGIFPGTNDLGLGGFVGGGSPGDVGSPFRGGHDEATMYARALSASEIQGIYNAGPAGKYNPSCISASTNAVGWWPGDGNTYDIAHTNMGAFINGSAYASAEVAQGFWLNGSNSYVRVENNDDLNPTNGITLEAWVYLDHYEPDEDGIYNNCPIFHKDGECANRQYLLTASYSGSFRVHIGLVDWGYVYFDGTTPIQAQTWYHVAETYDGTNLSLYINGALDNTASVDDTAFSPIITSTEPLMIGASDYACDSYFFPGIIDEPTIYNRALSATEIASIYAAGCAGKCKVDSDNDGLSNLQEAYLGTDPNNADTDGDGVTDGDEVFVNHTNPKDYYNGIPPILTILMGNNQSGMPTNFLPLPLVLIASSTNGVLLTNAPITFAGGSGAQVSSTPGGTVTSSLTVRTDTNGEAEAYVRLPAGWGTGSSVTASAVAGTNTLAVTFYATNLPQPKLWLKADAGISYYSPSNRINNWADQSGNGNTANADQIPHAPQLVTNVINGLPAVWFNTDFRFFYLPNFVSGFTQAEAFAMVKATTNVPPSGSQRLLWSFGTGSGTTYPDASSYAISDDFGRTANRLTGISGQRIDTFHLYNVFSRSGEWASRINGRLHFTDPNTSVAFTSSPRIGYGYFDGYIPEIMLFDRILTTSQRDGAGFYFNARYAWISPPASASGLSAAPLNNTQVSLQWTNSLSNTGTTYIIERKVNLGLYGVIATVHDGMSWIDTNAAPNATNTYRVQAANFAGVSAYSTEASAITEPGTLLPLSDAILWLKADSGITANTSTNYVSVWLDQSGHTNHAVDPFGTPVTQHEPIWLNSSSNGHPAVRFGTYNFFQLPNFLNGVTQAEIYAVLRATSKTGNSGLWQLGSYVRLVSPYTPAYPDTSGAISDAFAGDTYEGVPRQDITQFHFYNASAKPWQRTARINGQLFFSADNGTNQFTTSPLLGADDTSSGPYFDGDFQEILLFDRVLSPEERDEVGIYLQSKYAILSVGPPVPTICSITGTAPGRALVTWTNYSVTNDLVYTVERKTGSSGTWEQIAVVRDTNSFFDASLVPGTNSYYYRLKSWAYTGISDYSSNVAIPYVVITNLSPQAITTNGFNVIVGAIASAASGSVSKVEFFLDRSLYATVTTAPYAATLSGLSNGAHTISARATDSLANSAYSSCLTFTVSPDTDGDGVPDAVEILAGRDPTVSDNPPGPDPGDHTPPTIYLDEPLGATQLP